MRGEHVRGLHGNVNEQREPDDAQASQRKMPGQQGRDCPCRHAPIAHQSSARCYCDETRHDLGQFGPSRGLIEIDIAKNKEGAPRAKSAETIAAVQRSYAVITTTAANGMPAFPATTPRAINCPAI